ncbi:hypothetical protein RHGRI_036854 [Rhododendron griersonianum]|uniref:Uncharacterized protein n=1 Tax=Rhododendron griersonianum TaxID=479676 RepID=A0AAV6HSH2_9ERIC|nr:hypothetical protein RHGRI_036854 [Rhododendron griersonianum]
MMTEEEEIGVAVEIEPVEQSWLHLPDYELWLRIYITEQKVVLGYCRREDITGTIAFQLLVVAQKYQDEDNLLRTWSRNQIDDVINQAQSTRAALGSLLLLWQLVLNLILSRLQLEDCCFCNLNLSRLQLSFCNLLFCSYHMVVAVLLGCCALAQCGSATAHCSCNTPDLNYN